MTPKQYREEQYKTHRRHYKRKKSAETAAKLLHDRGAGAGTYWIFTITNERTGKEEYELVWKGRDLLGTPVSKFNS